MSNLVVNTATFLQGVVLVPSSKSQTIRGIFMAMLARGKSIIRNSLSCEDTADAVALCEQLGVLVERDQTDLHLTSSGIPLSCRASKIYTGNSGITTHFILPLLGLRLYPQPILVEAGSQMTTRPIGVLVNALKQLGLNVEYQGEKNYLPLQVSGRLKGGEITVVGKNSQPISALLMALPVLSDSSMLKVAPLWEKPYVDMTVHLLKKQGITVQHTPATDSNAYVIPAKQTYQPMTLTIAGDFSSAAYLIAACVLIPGKVRLYGLSLSDPQGDKALLFLLKDMGAMIEIGADYLEITGGFLLKGMAIDMKDIPDLLPILAVIGTQTADGLRLYHAEHTRIKETDRMHSMSVGLRKMGATLTVQFDELIISPSQLSGTTVNGFGDHRTVMALCVAALLAKGETIIEGWQAIQKTFPAFVTLMRSLGADLHEVPACDE